MIADDTDCWWITTASGPVMACEPDLASVTTQTLANISTWFEPEIDIAARLVGRSGVFIDIGANVGIYSINVGFLNEGAEIIAFEPNRRPRELFEKSIARNLLRDRIRVIDYAVSDTSEDKRFYNSDKSEFGSLNRSGDDYVTVKAAPLVDLVDEETLRRVDFIKVDAEGAELDIIEGSREFFENHDPVVMFEYMDDVSENVAVPQLLQTLGYRLYFYCRFRNALIPVSDPHKGMLNLFAIKRTRIAKLMANGIQYREKGGRGKSTPNINYQSYLEGIPHSKQLVAEHNRSHPAYKNTLRLCEKIINEHNATLTIDSEDTLHQYFDSLKRLVSKYGDRIEFYSIHLYLAALEMRTDSIGEIGNKIVRSINSSKFELPLLVVPLRYSEGRGGNFRDWYCNRISLTMYDITPILLSSIARSTEFFDLYVKHHDEESVTRAVALYDLVAGRDRERALKRLQEKDSDPDLTRSIVSRYG